MIEVRIEILNKPYMLSSLQDKHCLSKEKDVYIQEIFQHIIDQARSGEEYITYEDDYFSLLGSNNSEMMEKCLFALKTKDSIKIIQNGSTLQQISNQEVIQLLFIFPTYQEEFVTIIQIYCNDVFTYVYEYTNAETIKYILQNKIQKADIKKFIKNIIQFKKYQSISVNGKKIQSTDVKIKSFLQGKPDKIIIRINTNQNYSQLNPSENARQISNQKKNGEIKQEKHIKINEKQSDQKNERKVQANDKKKVEQNRINQKPKKPEKDIINVNIKFNSMIGNGSNKEHQFSFKKSMLINKALQQIIKLLKASGFDWPHENYDSDKDNDMISINFDGVMIRNFKQSFQKAFQGKDLVVLQINRVYSGG